MFRITPSNVTAPSPALIRRLERAWSIETARGMFLGAILLAVLSIPLFQAQGGSLDRAIFMALLVACWLTAATGPLLAKAYSAHALLFLQRRNASGRKHLSRECRTLQFWTWMIALALLLIVAALNIGVLWVHVYVVTLTVPWPGPRALLWLKPIAVVGFALLVWSDSMLIRATRPGHSSSK